MADETRADMDEHADHADGCLCDLEDTHLDPTTDADLPAASGGVEVESGAADGIDDLDVDGCGIVEGDRDASGDAELPVAVGGVA